MIEIAVKISDDDRTMTQNFLEYQAGMCVSHDDPTLKKYVDEALANFKGTAKDILVRIKYTW